MELLPKREKWALVGLAAVGIGAVTYVGARQMNRPPATTFEPIDSKSVAPAVPKAAKVKVHVVGAVKSAGVYEFDGEERVQDAIARAGGATSEADLEAINLAARLTDGAQLIVPKKGQAPAVAPPPTTTTAKSGGSKSGKAPSSIVNLNTASADQLCTVSGIGPATAEKILEYRRQHGGFTSIDELLAVKGIGEKKLAKMRPWLTVR